MSAIYEREEEGRRAFEADEGSPYANGTAEHTDFYIGWNRAKRAHMEAMKRAGSKAAKRRSTRPAPRRARATRTSTAEQKRDEGDPGTLPRALDLSRTSLSTPPRGPMISTAAAVALVLALTVAGLEALLGGPTP